MILSVECVKKSGACKEQVVLFEREFPNGMLVTKGNVEKLYALGGSILWAYKNLVGNEESKSIWMEYRSQVMRLYKRCGGKETDEYLNKLNILRAEYNKKTLPLLITFINSNKEMMHDSMVKNSV